MYKVICLKVKSHMFKRYEVICVKSIKFKKYKVICLKEKSICLKGMKSYV